MHQAGDKFNSAIIDVAIGMVISCLAVSLVISSLMKLRETTLLKGVQDLLNDQDFSGIARDLYNHALVNPLASGTARVIEDLTHKPAYIDSRQFALAIYGKLSENAWSPKGESPADVIAKIPDAKLKTAMESLWANSSQDVDAFKHNIAVWFDNAMDSVSGSYKRRIQWVSFLVALGIAVIFNVNVLYEAAQIWTRQSVIADAETTHFQADTAAADASKVLNALEPAFLIGWVIRPPILAHCAVKLDHRRQRVPLRRLVLVRHSPANHSPQGDGSRPETERQAAAA